MSGKPFEKAAEQSVKEKVFSYKTLVISFVAIIMMGVFLTFAIRAYNDYKETLVLQQQQFLLSISRNAARSVENYIDEKTVDLDVLDTTITKYNYETILDNYYAANIKALFCAVLIDADRNLVYDASAQEDVPYELILENFPIASYLPRVQNQTIIGRKFKTTKDEFAFIISQPVFIGGEYTYEVLIVMSIPQIYKTIIEPIKTGVKGYTLVKDSDGIILMHPFEEQVGMDVIDGRKEAFPGLDYADLEKLINLQLQGIEGYYMYNSYWWSDETPRKVIKLNGFAPAKIGDDFWVIATTLDFKELDLPVSSSFVSLFWLVAFIVLLFLATSDMLLKTIRDKKNLDKEMQYLLELNTALEDLQKSQQQLTHYQKLKTIGTFTSGIAHEINNLLTPILGYSEIILNSTDVNSETHEDVLEIYKASIKAKEIIEQILVYGRRTNSQLSFKYLSINEVVEGTLKMIETFIPPNIRLVKQIDENVGYVHGNATQISQMLINLYTNAYQSMKDIDGVLYVSLSKVEKSSVEALDASTQTNKYFVCITVSDTGCGIDSTILEEIFSPFFTTKILGEGTGLGLSVAEGIIINHKGIIKVESEVHRGSKFYIYLPYFEHDEQKLEKELNVISQKVKKGKKFNVLVIDDNKKITTMVKKGLSLEGYNVEISTNTHTVIETLQHQPNKYDIIITDFAMPQLNGAQLSRIIKKNETNVKIILMSGFINEELEQYLLQNIIDGYITKPFTIKALSNVIQSLLKE